MTRAEAFSKLEEVGAASAVVRYSGSGDEGGVDQIELLDEDDAVIHEIRDYYPDAASEPFFGAGDLAEVLAAPVDDQHGGFDGDGVDGQITWVVAERKVIDRPAYKEYVEHGPFEV